MSSCRDRRRALGTSAFLLLSAIACGDLSQAAESSAGTGGSGSGSEGTAAASTATTSTGGTSAGSGDAGDSTTAGVVDGTGSSSGAPPADSTATDATTSASSDSTEAGSSSTGDRRVTLGFPCEESDDCDEDAGEECCTANECAGTCMVPCANAGQCPVDGMGCHHGYCLFPCDDDDNDCAEWPGYTCRHMGNFCET